MLWMLPGHAWRTAVAEKGAAPEGLDIGCRTARVNAKQAVPDPTEARQIDK